MPTSKAVKVKVLPSVTAWLEFSVFAANSSDTPSVMAQWVAVLVSVTVRL